MKKILFLLISIFTFNSYAQRFEFKNTQKTVIIEARLKDYVDQFISDAKKYGKINLEDRLYSLDSIKVGYIGEIDSLSMGITRKKKGTPKIIIIQPFADNHKLKSVLYHELVHALYKIDDHLNDNRGSLINEYATTDWVFEKENWELLVEKLFTRDIPLLKKMKKINRKRKRKGLPPAITLEEAEIWFSNK